MSTDWKKYKKKFILPLIAATGIIFLLHCSSSKSECGKTDANCNYFSSILIQALNSSTDNPGLTLSPQPG
ncbi:MAG: hypothetical protein K8R21_05205, partial [Leptospira sp.]|nr:hypothetical protein [Leptospira sp.]